MSHPALRAPLAGGMISICAPRANTLFEWHFDIPLAEGNFSYVYTPSIAERLNMPSLSMRGMKNYLLQYNQKNVSKKEQIAPSISRTSTIINVLS